MLAEAGTKITPRLAQASSQDEGLKEVLRRDEDLDGRYVAADIVNDEDRRDLCRGRRRADREAARRKLEEPGSRSSPILDIDHINVGPYIRNTLAVDKNASARRR